MNTAERLMFENLVAWRILVVTGVALLVSYLTLDWLMGFGLARWEARAVTFLLMNCVLFATCARYWMRGVLPIAPEGWRRGTRARIGIVLLIVHASVWAILPLDVQLMFAFGLAWLKLHA